MNEHGVQKIHLVSVVVTLTSPLWCFGTINSTKIMLAVFLVINTNLYIFLLFFTVFIVCIGLARRGKSAKVVYSKKDKKFSIIPKVWEFKFKEGDGNLAVSLRNENFGIRIKKNPTEKDYREYALSLFCISEISESEIAGFLSTFPQVKEIIPLDSHTVRVGKSAATSWTDIEDDILVFLFKFLDKKHSWRYEKQKVQVERTNNENYIKFRISIETKYLIPLGKNLLQIKGVANPYPKEYPLTMDHEYKYDFDLTKAETFTWDDLRPEIEGAFENFFPKGVTFSGIWESKK